MSKEYHFLIGNYAEGEKQGIYFLSYNPESRYVNIRRDRRLRRPAYICRNKSVFYAVTEVPLTEGMQGMITAFTAENAEIQILDQQKALEPLIPHINCCSQTLYYCSYGMGTVTSIGLMSDGRFGNVTKSVQRIGKSIHPKRQLSSHPHSVWIAPDRKSVFVCDLGTDTLAVYELNSEGSIGELLYEISDFELGQGPRHMVWHPNGEYAYLLTEMGYRIYILKRNDNKYNVIRYVDAGYDLQKINYDNMDEANTERAGAAIRITIDGKYLYVSNRGDNSSRIDAFSLANKKMPEHIGSFAKGCDCPRDFILTKDEKFLVCTNQLDNSVTFYKRNKFGELEFFDQIGDFVIPACIFEL